MQPVSLADRRLQSFPSVNEYLFIWIVSKVGELKKTGLRIVQFLGLALQAPEPSVNPDAGNFYE